jgi:AcrR family transcriptional regulator
VTTPQLPNDAQIRAAADTLLAAHRDGGAYPSVSALAKEFDINRTTFYRHFPTIAQYLLDTAACQQSEGPKARRPPTKADDRDAVIRRLRNENSDLRRHLDIYEEHIRMLTIENARQREQLELNAGVTDITDRRSSR